LTLAALAPPATGAEYRDGKLWLDILLNSGTELTVTAPPGKAPGFLLSETIPPSKSGYRKASASGWQIPKSLPTGGCCATLNPGGKTPGA